VSGGGVRYAWNFGDSASGATNTSAQVNPSHTFSASGSYQVKETVTDAFGQTNSITQTVDVVDYAAPTAAFDDNCSSDGSCSLSDTNPFEVDFNDSSYNNDGAIVAWSWNFGDPGSGASNTDANQYPYHDYNAPGQYTVTLTVTDEHGKQATTSQTVYIDP
jgi:PKD repeat protein